MGDSRDSPSPWLQLFQDSTIRAMRPGSRHTLLTNSESSRSIMVDRTGHGEMERGTLNVLAEVRGVDGFGRGSGRRTQQCRLVG